MSEPTKKQCMLYIKGSEGKSYRCSDLYATEYETLTGAHVRAILDGDHDDSIFP